MITRTWIGAGRVRRRLKRARQGPPPRESLIRAHAPGKSFADIGCMWKVDGELCFLAEEAGAREVTGLDVMPPSPRFVEERTRQGSRVHFVQGDLHDEAAMAEVGRHDVVWCSGVLYHAPHPVLTLERLRAITGELLILATETLPEIPGVEGGCVFLPGLSDAARRALGGGHGGERIGVSTPFDPSQRYGNWWWGITASALRGMLAATGFEVVELHDDTFHATALARPVP